MGRDLNSVFVVGRLIRDAEFKVTPTGKELLKCTIANNSAYSDDANFFEVAIWGKAAAALKDYLFKWKQIAIQGRLQYQKWTTAEGQQRSKIEIVAENVQLLGGGQRVDTGEPSRDPVAVPVDAEAAAKKVDSLNPLKDEIPF
jgi:single-strand DNA-binding protein